MKLSWSCAVVVSFWLGAIPTLHAQQVKPTSTPVKPTPAPTKPTPAPNKPIPIPSVAPSAQPSAVPPTPAAVATPTPKSGSSTTAPKAPPIKGSKKNPKVTATKRATLQQKPAPGVSSPDQRVGAQLGLVSGKLPGGGLDFYYPFGPGHMGFVYLFGQAQVNPEFGDATDFKVENGVARVQLINLSYVYEALKNWVVVKGGLGFRTIHWEYDLTGDGSAASAVIDANSLCVNGSLGSYWTIGTSLIAGVDWVGFNLPLTGQSAATVSTSGGFQANKTQISNYTEQLGSDTASSMGIQTLLFSISYIL